MSEKLYTQFCTLNTAKRISHSVAKFIHFSDQLSIFGSLQFGPLSKYFFHKNEAKCASFGKVGNTDSLQCALYFTILHTQVEYYWSTMFVYILNMYRSSSSVTESTSKVQCITMFVEHFPFSQTCLLSSFFSLFSFQYFKINDLCIGQPYQKRGLSHVFSQKSSIIS